jgi:outer membrane lipoprotein-sorting protein
MKEHKDEKWLDETISRATEFGDVKFDAEKWRDKYILNKSPKTSYANFKFKPHYNIWRIIMENKVTRYSAAAVVALAAVLVLFGPFGTSQNGSVAMADVQEKIEQIDTMIFSGHKAFSSVDDPNVIFEFDFVKYISKEYGITEQGYIKDTLVYTVTFNLPKKEARIVMHAWKKYLKFQCSEKQLELMEKLDPKGIVELLTQANYEKLGFSEIDGIEVEGFVFDNTEVNKEAFPESIFNIEQSNGKIWVGVEELIPLRMETDISIGKCLFTAFNNFNLHEDLVLQDYNVNLDKEKFDTGIPEGYTKLTLSDFLSAIPLKVKAGVTGLGLGFFR